MVWTVAAMLTMFWWLGIATGYPVGGLIHILLMGALVTGAVGLMNNLRLE